MTIDDVGLGLELGPRIKTVSREYRVEAGGQVERRHHHYLHCHHLHRHHHYHHRHQRRHNSFTR